MDEHERGRGEDDQRRLLPGMGALIGIGAGFGLILGLIFENLAIGLAGAGPVSGRLQERSWRASAARVRAGLPESRGEP